MNPDFTHNHSFTLAEGSANFRTRRRTGTIFILRHFVSSGATRAPDLDADGFGDEPGAGVTWADRTRGDDMGECSPSVLEQ